MRGFIFDLDGTLLDSIGLWLQIDKDYMKMHGIEYKREYSDEIKKLTYVECAYYFRDVLKVNKDVDSIQKDWIEMSHKAYAENLQLKPYAYEFVQKCAKQGKCIIATSCRKDSALAALKRCGLMDFMVDVITTDELNSSKENPLIYQICAKRLGCDIESCVVFEDVCTAAQCAKKAGFHVVGIYDDMWKADRELMMQICDKYVMSFKELL